MQEDTPPETTWVTERRPDPRQDPHQDVVRTAFTAFAFADALGGTLEVVVVNLSVGGVGVTGMPPLGRGARVTLELHLGELEIPAAQVGRGILRAVAEVAWSDADSRAAGLRFVDLRDDQRAVLDAVVTWVRSGSGPPPAPR